MSSGTNTVNSDLSRRSLLLASAGVGVTGALAACGSSDAGAGSSSEEPVVFAMFGNAEKVELREQAFNTYLEKHPDAPAEFMGTQSDAWPDKIATMVAGGNAPDAINLGAGDVFAYANRGALAPLDSVDGFETANFRDPVLDLGRDSEGTLYAAPIAASTQALLYNESLLDRLGIEQPTGSWTWDEFFEICEQVYDASDGEVYGTHDLAQGQTPLELWLRSQGGALFDDSGVAASVDEVIEWLTMWEDLRASGACVPPELASAFTPGAWPNQPVVKGTAVFNIVAVQDLAGGYQALMEDTCKFALPPSGTPGGSSGLYSVPSSCMTLNAQSKNPELAVDIINFFVSAPEPAQVLRLISGPPAATTAMEAIMELDDLDAVEQITLDYALAAFEELEPISSMAIQANSNAMTDLFRRSNEEVAFGHRPIDESAQELIEQAGSMLQQ